jgi:hypothetical protein
MISFILDLFQPLTYYLIWKLWEFIKLKLLKAKGIKIVRDEIEGKIDIKKKHTSNEDFAKV